MPRTFTKAARVIQFELTPEDIQLGYRAGRNNTQYWCPLARAIRRAVNNVGVAVGWGYAQIYWVEGEKGVWYTHQYESKIKVWDKYGKLEPFKGVLTRV